MKRVHIKKIRLRYVLLLYTLAVCCVLTGVTQQLDAAGIAHRVRIEWIDPVLVDAFTGAGVPRTTDAVYSRSEQHVIAEPVRDIYLEAGDEILFDCSYTPIESSVGFGLFSEDGKFYHLRGNRGEFIGAIRIYDSGTYSFAIRNNSEKALTVSGTLTYGRGLLSSATAGGFLRRLLFARMALLSDSGGENGPREKEGAQAAPPSAMGAGA